MCAFFPWCQILLWFVVASRCVLSEGRTKPSSRAALRTKTATARPRSRTPCTTPTPRASRAKWCVSTPASTPSAPWFDVNGLVVQIVRVLCPDFTEVAQVLRRKTQAQSGGADTPIRYKPARFKLDVDLHGWDGLLHISSGVFLKVV